MVPDGGMRFGYHRTIAPMMWVIVGLGTIELFVMHFLLSFWSHAAALVLSSATLLSVGWLVRAIMSMKRLPVTLDRDRLVMQVGTIRRAEVAFANVAGLRASWDAAAINDPSVLNLALLAYPNVVVDLIEPLPGRRGFVAIAHRLDDPAAFTNALERLRAGT